MSNIASHYLRRAAHSVWRAIAIGLFTHTPCPSRAVTEAIVREDRLQREAEAARAERTPTGASDVCNKPGATVTSEARAE